MRFTIGPKVITITGSSGSVVMISAEVNPEYFEGVKRALLNIGQKPDGLAEHFLEHGIKPCQGLTESITDVVTDEVQLASIIHDLVS